MIFILRLLILVFLLSASNSMAQSNLQIILGANYGGLYSAKKTFNNKGFRFQSGIAYVEPLTKNWNFGFEVNISEYKIFDSYRNLNRNYTESYFLEINYKAQAIGLQLSFERYLLHRENFKLSLPLNIGFSRMIFSKLEGIEIREKDTYVKDSLGGETRIEKAVEKNVLTSHKDYKEHIFFGISLGLKAYFKLSNRIDLLLQNSYFLSTRAVNTFLIRNSTLTVGISYRLNKKLNISKILEKSDN